MSEIQSVDPSPSEEMLITDEAISSEEREEFQREIDKVVDDNRISVTSELFKISNAKKGVALPLLINILAAAVIVGGFFFASWYFEQKKETLSLQSESFLSAEGRLIAELKREAEARLAEKDGEISEIQTQLTAIEQERTALVENMDAQIQEREQQLRDALERQLALEKSRLEALGRSDEDIAAQLQQLEAKVTAEQTQELNAFKQQAEAEIQEKEAELVQNRQLTQQILEEARTERADLEARSEAREEELVAQYEQEKAELAERTTEVEQQLEQINIFQAQEKLISDQIVGTYSLIQQKIADGDFADAKANVEQLRTLLYDPSIESLPNVAGRRDADLFILDSLEELVESRAAVEESKTSDSILQTANLLDNARGAVARADSEYETGSNAEAKRLYMDALKLVPSLSKAYANLVEIETAEDRTLLTEAISAGNALFQSGNVASAVTTYSQAVASASGANRTLAAQAVSGITDSLEFQHNGVVEGRDDTIAQLRSQISSRDERISSLQSNLDDASRQLADEKRISASLRDSLNRANQQIDDQNTRISAFADAGEAKDRQIADLNDYLTESDKDLAKLEAENSDLRFEVEALDFALESSRAEASALANDLASANDRISSLQDSVSGLETQLANADTGSQTLRDELAAAKVTISDLQTDVEVANAKISSLETDLASSIQQAGALEADVAAAGASIESLKSDLAAAGEESEDLGNQVAALTTSSEAEKARLSEALSAETAKVASLQTQVTEAEAEIASLNARLDDADSSDVETELAAANQTIEELTAKVEELESAEPVVQVTDVELEQLRDAYERYVDTIEPLVGTGDESDIRDARQIFSVFFERINEQAFPGIYDVWNKTDQAYIELERSLYEETGRKNTLNEIIRYVDYLKAGDEASIAAQIAFDALGNRDLLYKRAFDGISDIARSGLTDEVSRSEFLLAGNVGSYSSGTVTVDSELAASINDNVLIKRIGADGTESTLAQGVVTAVDAGAFSVEIRRFLSSTTPGSQDRVYIETEQP